MRFRSAGGVVRSVMRGVMRGLMLGAVAACGGSGDSTGPDGAVPASITIEPAGGTLDAIGATIQLTATVRGADGRRIAKPSVAWRTGSTGIALVSSSGLVTGVANGTTEITAIAGSVEGHASITVAQVPYALIKISGDEQTGGAGQPLGAPLVVQVNDRLEHPIAGVDIAFSAAEGNGSVSPASATTGADGQVEATWTLGSTVGAQRASATVATLDSAHFTATALDPATAPRITQIAPDTLVEGETVTIAGENFSSAPANDVVTIDGVVATVSAATATSLTVVVPSFPCRPARLVTVSVQASGQTATRSAVPLRPAAFTTLAVGEEAVVRDPTQFCFQLPASASGDEIFIMGLSAPADVPGAVLPFQITVQGGASATTMLATALPAPRIAPHAARRAARVRPARSLADLGPSLERARQRAQAEASVRRWEAARIPALAARARTRAPIAMNVRPFAASALPSVGDTLTLRVPDLGADDACTSYTTIRAAVRVVGTAGIWVQDITNPTTDSLTLADIQAASDQFDAWIYAADTTYFGAPSDIDGNGRVIVVLTWQVNKVPNVLGFVFGGDLFPGDPFCPQSNGGELYYGEVPDPENVAGTEARTRADVVAQMPALIAHEFAHVIQFSQRLVLHDGTAMALWAMEGQATLAEELVGNAVLGNDSYQNYGFAVAFGAGGSDWYADPILKWVEYFGVLDAGVQAPDAPDLCTVYGNPQLPTPPCHGSAFYGASWILQRYIADQYGPTYPGGLAQLTRDWIAKNVTLRGPANIGALLGVDYDALFVRFATALALDDQPNATGTSWVPREFRITSWDSGDLSAGLDACCGYGWLAPPSMTFTDATARRRVRSGSTAYTVLTAGGPHAAAALRVSNSNGTPLSTALRPSLWIVRVQ